MLSVIQFTPMRMNLILLFIAVAHATNLRQTKEMPYIDQSILLPVWRCMNFYGFETEAENTVCSWAHPPSWYMERLKKWMGINSLRVPFSYSYVSKGDMSKLDDFIVESYKQNIDIILDYHRTWPTHQGPTPEEGIEREDFLGAWVRILERYQMFPNVRGIGPFNEIQRADFDYTIKLHQDFAKEIESRFPNRFEYFFGCPSWGGDCSQMERLKELTVWNRSKVEVHKYKFSGVSNPNDWDKSMPSSISSDHWFVGETGWRTNVIEEKLWGDEFIDYLIDRKISNVCLWTIAHSYDTNGWWEDDCETFNVEKALHAMKVWGYSDGSKLLPHANLYLDLENDNPYYKDITDGPVKSNCTCLLRDTNTTVYNITIPIKGNLNNTICDCSSNATVTQVVVSDDIVHNENDWELSQILNNPWFHFDHPFGWPH